MSHFTHIETRIRDIAALEAACAELGLELTKNAEARGYGRKRIQGDYVIKLRGPYDVAIQQATGGPYRVIADLWNGHVEEELGRDFGKLKQLYGVHKATLEARKKGLIVRRQNQQNGGVRLTLCR